MRGGRGGRWQRRTEPYREPPHGAVAPSPARATLRVSSPGRPSGHTPPPGLRPGTVRVPPGQAGRGPAARHRRRFREDLRLSPAAPRQSPLRPTPFPRPRERIPPAGGPLRRRAGDRPVPRARPHPGLGAGPPSGRIPGEDGGERPSRAGACTAAPAPPGPAAVRRQPRREAPGRKETGAPGQRSGLTAPLSRAGTNAARPPALPPHSGRAGTFQDGLH